MASLWYGVEVSVSQRPSDVGWIFRAWGERALSRRKRSEREERKRKEEEEGRKKVDTFKEHTTNRIREQTIHPRQEKVSDAGSQRVLQLETGNSISH